MNNESLNVVEEENQHNYKIEKYERPSFTADRLIFTVKTTPKAGKQLPNHELQILMIKRGKWPYAGCWAFPGGFSNKGETIEQTAERELLEETTLDNVYKELLGTYSKPGRDPRGWIISNAYYSLINSDTLVPKGSDDAVHAEWLPVDQVLAMVHGDENGEATDNDGKLAFDHDEMLQDAVEALKLKIHQSDVAKEFLPEEFTASELMQIIKLIDSTFDDRYANNFTRKMLQRKILEATGNTHNKYAPNQTTLYRFTGKLPKLSYFE